MNRGFPGAVCRLAVAGVFVSCLSLSVFRATPAVAAGDGLHPSGAVICEGGAPYYGSGVLYGVTNTGGANNLGVVYRLTTTTTPVETILHSFTGTDGSNPVGALAGPPNSSTSGNSTLYGVAYNGGAGGKGTLFQITTGGAFLLLHSFTGSDGANPTSVIWDGGSTLYGTCYGGGASGKGSLFRYSLTTGQFTTLYSFSGSTDGANPNAALFLDHGVLYGTAANGGGGYGTVFSIAASGGTLSTLHGFTSSDGANPACQFLLKPGTSTLLGTTAKGGTWSTGTIFEINENGTGFQSLASFAAAGANNNTGQYPSGGLVIDPQTATYTSPTYWGVTSGGGSGGAGALYSYQVGSMLSNAAESFTPSPSAMGNTPVGPPVVLPTIVGGPEFYLVSNYYGGVTSGGVNLNDGVLFEWVGYQPNAAHTFGP